MSWLSGITSYIAESRIGKTVGSVASAVANSPAGKFVGEVASAVANSPAGKFVGRWAGPAGLLATSALPFLNGDFYKDYPLGQVLKGIALGAAVIAVGAAIIAASPLIVAGSVGAAVVGAVVVGATAVSATAFGIDAGIHYVLDAADKRDAEIERQELDLIRQEDLKLKQQGSLQVSSPNNKYPSMAGTKTDDSPAVAQASIDTATDKAPVTGEPTKVATATIVPADGKKDNKRLPAPTASA